MTSRLALAALLALTFGCRDAQKEETETEAAVPVETKPARVDTVQGVVSATGVVRAAPGAQQDITAPSAARIAEMPRAIGDRVRPGDLLIRFDSPTLRADAAAKNAAQQEARARLDNAREAETRIAGLYERGISARKELEDARRELRQSEAALAQAEGESLAATQLADRAIVHALFGGVIVARTHNPGDLVEAGGEPLLRLVDPSRLQVEASVAMSDLARVQRKRAARVRLSGTPRDSATPATVQGVSTSVNADTGTGLVLLKLDAGTGLPAGAPVAVEIDAERHEGVIAVPEEALVHDSGNVYVYVVGADKKAHRREVTLGVRGGGDVEIRTGVQAGEAVVVRGQDGLPDGATVAIAP